MPHHGCSRDLSVRSHIATQWLELVRRSDVARLLVHFTNNATEESLISLAMAAKQPNLARIEDAGIVVAALQQIAPLRIDQDGAGDFPVRSQISTSVAKASGEGGSENAFESVRLRCSAAPTAYGPPPAQKRPASGAKGEVGAPPASRANVPRVPRLLHHNKREGALDHGQLLRASSA